jgi:acetyltransferase
MELMIEYARAEGLKRVAGQILHDNTVMIRMCKEFGFEVRADPLDREISIATLLLE